MLVPRTTDKLVLYSGWLAKYRAASKNIALLLSAAQFRSQFQNFAFGLLELSHTFFGFIWFYRLHPLVETMDGNPKAL